MTRIHRGIALALVAVAVAAAACRKNPETVAQPTGGGNAGTGTPTETCNQRCRDSINNANRVRDSLETARIAREAAATAIASATNTLKATIYYDYDASDIRGDAKSALDAKLPILRANSGVMLRISGHADERGSDQYNDALGQARAAAAKRYLTDNGIDANRIQIVSYGETRPSTNGADENAWARNRRAEFEITSGSVTTAR